MPLSSNSVSVFPVFLFLTGCVSSPPAAIGPDTYYASKSTAGGEFGNTGAALGHLIGSCNKFCAAMGKQFLLVTQTQSPSGPSQPIGGASITFKCVKSSVDVVVRPDDGATSTGALDKH